MDFCLKAPMIQRKSRKKKRCEEEKEKNKMRQKRMEGNENEKGCTTLNFGFLSKRAYDLKEV